MRTSWIKRLAAAAWPLWLAGAAHAGDLVGPPELLWSGPVRALAAADLDQDGDLDLVVSDGIETLRAFDNVGAGVFQLSQRSAASGPRELALGDLDGDGDADLVTMDAFAPLAYVRDNLGDGRFAAPVTYRSVWNPTDVEIVDLDGDHANELVLVGSEELVVLLNDGDGGFDQTYPFDPEICRRESVVPLDADGDGAIDLAVSGGAGVFSFQCCGGLRVIQNGGDQLVNGGVYIEESCHEALAAGDVDGDGDTDLAVTYSDGFLTHHGVLLNDGSGAFLSGWSVSSLGLVLRSLDLVDLDGDGALDLVGETRAWLNDGGGSFGSGSQSLVADPWPHGSVQAQELADVDGDGDEDLVLGASGALVLLRSLAVDGR